MDRICIHRTQEHKKVQHIRRTMYHTIYVRIHRNIEEVDASVKELPYNGRSKHDFSFSLCKHLDVVNLKSDL